MLFVHNNILRIITLVKKVLTREKVRYVRDIAFLRTGNLLPADETHY